MLTKYEEFLLEKIENEFLSLLNEAIFLMSPKLSNVISLMADSNKSYAKIAKMFLDIELLDIDTNISYLDITDDNSMVSFLNPEKAEKFVSDNNIRRSEVYNKLKGNSVRVGKLVRKVIEMYNKSSKRDEKFTDKEIEDFVNGFKSNYDFLIKGTINFKVFEGDDILASYLEDNYHLKTGSLGGSCMRYEESQDYLQFYIKNGVKVLALLGPNDSICGRALLWNLTSGETFMDRIYTIKDSDINLFKKYAEEKSYIYKSEQNFRESVGVMSPDDNYSEPVSKNLEVDVKKSNREHRKYESFPYLDTLKYYYWEDGKLTNYVIPGKTYVKLVDTDGWLVCDKCDNDGEVECANCDGMSKVDCSDCKGEGEIECSECHGDGEIKCVDCKGTGSVDQDKCMRCDGSGSLDCNSCSNGHIKCEECDRGRVSCDDCDGDGVVKCPRCDGYSNRWSGF